MRLGPARHHEPARPTFDHDQFEGMAEYVMSRGLRGLTAAGPSKFFINN
jgi:hypothetical protein